MTDSVWTDQVVAYLTEKAAAGWPATKIANGLGSDLGVEVTRSAVVGCASRRGIKLAADKNRSIRGKSKAPEQLDYVRQLAAQGLSASMIADSLNAKFNLSKSKDAIVGLARRHAIELKPTVRKSSSAGDHISKLIAKAQEVAASLDAPLADSNPVTLSDLGENHCRWPITCDGADQIMFCGATKIMQSYCIHHYLKSIDRSTSRGKERVR